MTEAEIREAVELIRDNLATSIKVAEVHTGPRSNELWFVMTNGNEVRASIVVKGPQHG